MVSQYEPYDGILIDCDSEELAALIRLGVGFTKEKKIYTPTEVGMLSHKNNCLVVYDMEEKINSYASFCKKICITMYL